MLPPQPSAIRGLVIYIGASLALLLLLCVGLFLRHTSCFSYVKYGLLRGYSKCCKCSPFYKEYLAQEARELRQHVEDNTNNDMDVFM